jgi:hypothetical protein
VFLRNSRGQGPPPQDFPEIYRPRLPGIGKAQGLMDLGSHLVAGPADGRAQVDQEFSGSGSEMLNQTSESRFQNARRDTPPTGMENSQGPPSGIYQKNGNAIRHRHTQEDPESRRGVAVCVGGYDQLWGSTAAPPGADLCQDVELLVNGDGSAVDLPGAHDGGQIHGSAQVKPLGRFTRGLIVSEEGEVRRRIVHGRTGGRFQGFSRYGAASGPLDKPGKLKLPLRVDPAVWATRAPDLLDPAEPLRAL